MGPLRLLQKQGKTILIAEHRLYYLMELADRIVYLEQGRIEKIFTPEEFRRLPKEARERMTTCISARSETAISLNCPGAKSRRSPSPRSMP